MMSKICASCGKELPDNVSFCTECGAPVAAKPETNEKEIPIVDPATGSEVNSAPESAPKTASAAPSAAPAAVAASAPDAAYRSTYQQQTNPYSAEKKSAAPTDSRYKVVGFGSYFGLMFLFGIPIIGFIACLITMFAPSNKSIKNYARARFLWTVIGLLVGALILFCMSFFITKTIDKVKDDIRENLPQEDIAGDFGSFSDDDINQLLEQFGIDDINQFLEQFGGLAQ